MPLRHPVYSMKNKKLNVNFQRKKLTCRFFYKHDKNGDIGEYNKMMMADDMHKTGFTKSLMI
jgi:hypothetical protein